MKACRQLPDGYREILHIDLQHDKKLAAKVNLMAGAVMVLLLILGFILSPAPLSVGPENLSAYLLRCAVLLVGYVLYIILHELTHAAAMKAVGGRSVVFGFTGLYAFAGSKEDWFDKTAYRFIALAPLVLWGILFGVLLAVLPREWFLVIWILGAGNIAGSFGDIYVTLRLLRQPASVLIRDTGVEMRVYGPAAGLSADKTVDPAL